MLTEDERRTQHLYDVVAADYARLLPDVALETEDERRLLSGVVPLTGLVLDVGCGTGRVAAHLRSLGATVVGLDLSPGMLAVARAADPDVPLVAGSLRRLPLRDASVAAVLAWYSVIHTAPSDLPAVVGELVRVLVPGGALLLAFQSGEGERVDRTTAYGHDVARTNHRHRVEDVVALLERYGVQLVEQVVRPPEAEHEIAWQAALLGVRVR